MKMRGSETVKEDFKTQIFDIFGTVDLEQLRAYRAESTAYRKVKNHIMNAAQDAKTARLRRSWQRCRLCISREWEQRSWRKVRHQSPDDLQAAGTRAELQ